MTPVVGFSTADRALLEGDTVVTEVQESPECTELVEMNGRLRLEYTVKPTPRVIWNFESQ